MPLDVADDALLPCDVPGVADFRFDALRHGRGHALAAADDPCDQVILDVGAAHQLHRCAADLAQLGALGGSGAQVGQLNAGCLQPLQLGLLARAVTAEHRPPRIIDQPVFPADGGQPLIGVVLPQAQAVLAAARHHAVGVQHTLCHKVIDQRTKVACVPRQHQLFFAQRVAGGVQTGQQALRGGLLVAGGAVELPGTVDAAHDLTFQRGL